MKHVYEVLLTQVIHETAIAHIEASSEKEAKEIAYQIADQNLVEIDWTGEQISNLEAPEARALDEDEVEDWQIVNKVHVSVNFRQRGKNCYVVKQLGRWVKGYTYEHQKDNKGLYLYLSECSNVEEARAKMEELGFFDIADWND
ncbi:hypothetical protein F7R25_03985 [Burkholderia stagnalis]|uniref:Uncharacterized protein n=1 Tax=Burkholderia stagnalis TaxID=1503054 RepID=A0A6L3N405_9BURK|nr:hypothetical protein [Burkholderia stagnalis]KAB0640664.1 hypothetical protein F7R25_03985 [Burkholderia stagnalis]VWB06200.1 hypothetical protein BST28156_00107 [Burkholderia stagnalis]